MHPGVSSPEPSQPNESLLLHQAQVSRLRNVDVPAFGNLNRDSLPLANQADPRSHGLLIAIHPLRLFVSPAATAPVKHAGTVL